MKPKFKFGDRVRVHNMLYRDDYNVPGKRVWSNRHFSDRGLEAIFLGRRTLWNGALVKDSEFGNYLSKDYPSIKAALVCVKAWKPFYTLFEELEPNQ